MKVCSKCGIEKDECDYCYINNACKKWKYN